MNTEVRHPCIKVQVVSCGPVIFVGADPDTVPHKKSPAEATSTGLVVTTT